MCGHVGIAGKLEFRDEATLKRLLLLDYFRGTDSTGVAAIRKDNTVRIAKIASHPIDLFDTKSYEKVNSAYQTKVFVGHNRAATKGKVNGANAHPYEYGHIIGAHNGTLTQPSWTALNNILGYETDVDSMAIFACIEKVGIEETVKHLQGAWALVWVNTEDRTLNFLRNKERSFWYSYTKDFGKVIWASEWPMIQAATEMATKNDQYELYFNPNKHCFFSTEIDTHYQWNFDKLADGGYKELPKPRVKELKGKEPAPVTTYNQGQSPFKGGSGTSSTSTTSGTSTPKTAEQITIITSPGEPFGSIMNKDEFVRMSNNKCCFCNEPVAFEDEGLVVFENIGEVLCSECSGHTTTRYMATPKSFHNHLFPTTK